MNNFNRRLLKVVESINLPHRKFDKLAIIIAKVSTHVKYQSSLILDKPQTLKLSPREISQKVIEKQAKNNPRKAEVPTTSIALSFSSKVFSSSQPYCLGARFQFLVSLISSYSLGDYHKHLRFLLITQLFGRLMEHSKLFHRQNIYILELRPLTYKIYHFYSFISNLILRIDQISYKQQENKLSHPKKAKHYSCYFPFRFTKMTPQTVQQRESQQGITNSNINQIKQNEMIVIGHLRSNQE